MNIVSNNCLGGYAFNILEMQHQNPFAFCTIFDDDFIYIMEHFNEINWSNIEILPVTREHLDSLRHQEAWHIISRFKDHKFSNSRRFFYVRVDDKVNIHMVHVYERDGIVGCKKYRTSVATDDARTYIYNQWMRRLERMTEKPTYVVFPDAVGGYSNMNRYVELKKRGVDFVLIGYSNKRYNDYLDITIDTHGVARAAQAFIDNITGTIE